MRYEIIGTSNLKFSKIILGTWQAGKEMWADIDDKDSIAAIRGALDVGITSIDTAMVYGNGHSEQIIATALKGVPRTSYQIATKVFSNKLKFKHVLEECNKSLKNLQTDVIDLYQIHWPSGSFSSEIVPIHETMEAMNKLKVEGKIRHIGVSNFSKQQLQEALQYGEIVSNQPPYSLLWRYYDKQTNTFCRENGISILAYSPLAQGILTGKFKSGHVFAPGDHRATNKLLSPEIFDKVEIVLAGLQKFADKYKTTIGNVALNWLISQQNSFAIVGMRNVEQVHDTAKCCDFTLTDTELKELDTLSETVTKHMHQNEVQWQW
jgi:myo-inositol catabolism protein IolS